MFTVGQGRYFSKYITSKGDLMAGNVVIIVAVDADYSTLKVVKSGDDTVHELSFEEVSSNKLANVSETRVQAAQDVYQEYKNSGKLPDNVSEGMKSIELFDEESITEALIRFQTYKTSSGEPLSTVLITTDELSEVRSKFGSWKETIQSLSASADVIKFHLGGCLLNALASGEHVNAGYGSKAEDFIKWVNDTFGFGQAKAYQLMAVYDRLTNIGVTEDQVRNVSYRKLYSLVKYITAGNANSLLSLARSLNSAELAEQLKNMFSGEGAQTEESEDFDDSTRQVQNVKFNRFTFSLSEDETAILNQAIEQFTVENPDYEIQDKNPLRQPIMAILMQYMQDGNPLEILNQSPEVVKKHLEAINPNIQWSFAERDAEAYSVEVNQNSLLDLDYA